MRTIEGELEAAFVKSGLISAHRGQLSQNGYSRCARTDKGVHAAGQVITLFLPVRDTPEAREEARDRINAVLPPAIRVLILLRVPHSFDARHQCNARRYEYLLPTFVLRPVMQNVAPSRGRDRDLDPVTRARLVAAIRSGDRTLADLLQAEARAGPAGSHLRAGQTAIGGLPDLIAAFARGRAAWAASRGAGALADAHRHLLGAPAAELSMMSVAEAAQRAALRVVPGHVPATAAPSWLAGLPVLALQARVAVDHDKLATQHMLERQQRWGFRLTSGALARLREACECFVGPHAFHNFTPKLTAGDAQTRRHIYSMDVSEPFLVAKSGIMPGMSGTDIAAIEATTRALLIARVMRHKSQVRRRLARKRARTADDGPAPAAEPPTPSKVARDDVVSSASEAAHDAPAPVEVPDVVHDDDGDDDDDHDAAAAADDEADDQEPPDADPIDADADGDAAMQAVSSSRKLSSSRFRSGGDDDDDDGDGAFEDEDDDDDDEDDDDLIKALVVSTPGGEVLDFSSPDAVTEEEIERARALLGVQHVPEGMPMMTQADLEAAGPEYAMEFVRFTIEGQSFLLNQIRHMVGLVVDFARHAVPRSVFAQIFGPFKTTVPLAPAEGLFLHTARFTNYNRHLPEGREELSWDRGTIADRHRQFKEQYIWAHIARQCAIERPFEKWASKLISRPYAYNLEAVSVDVIRPTGAYSRTAIRDRTFRETLRSSGRGLPSRGSLTRAGHGRRRAPHQMTQEVFVRLKEESREQARAIIEQVAAGSVSAGHSSRRGRGGRGYGRGGGDASDVIARRGFRGRGK